MPRGGPSGGDGGTGGSIFFRADENEYTLQPLRYKRTLKARPGAAGESRDKYGAAADDVIIRVPLGTVIYDSVSGEVIAHMVEHGQQWCAATGGI